MEAHSLYRLFDEQARRVLERLPETGSLEELRVRAGRGVEAIATGGRRIIPLVCSSQDILRILQNAAQQSLYAYEEQIRSGFITVAGGHRIGFAGRVHSRDGKIESIDCFSSLNMRVARCIPGAGKAVEKLITLNRRVVPSLFASAPGVGKTTLLRDLARIISGKGLKVALVDERGELASCDDGVPSLDVGERTDVLDGSPKAEGMRLLVRSMSPEVIVTDELAGPGDVDAAAGAVSSGVSVLASAHATSMGELMGRPDMREAASRRIFSRYVFLERSNGSLRARAVYDAYLKEVGIA